MSETKHTPFSKLTRVVTLEAEKLIFGCDRNITVMLKRGRRSLKLIGYLGPITVVLISLIAVVFVLDAAVTQLPFLQDLEIRLSIVSVAVAALWLMCKKTMEKPYGKLNTYEKQLAEIRGDVKQRSVSLQAVIGVWNDAPQKNRWARTFCEEANSLQRELEAVLVNISDAKVLLTDVPLEAIDCDTTQLRKTAKTVFQKIQEFCAINDEFLKMVDMAAWMETHCQVAQLVDKRDESMKVIVQAEQEIASLNSFLKHTNALDDRIHKHCITLSQLTDNLLSIFMKALSNKGQSAQWFDGSSMPDAIVSVDSGRLKEQFQELIMQDPLLVLTLLQAAAKPKITAGQGLSLISDSTQKKKS